MRVAVEFIVDKPFAIASVEARKAGVRSLLTNLRQKLELHTAVDIGCGVGYFSAFLHEMGFEVVGVDGRKDNVREAQARHPQVPFEHGNLEDPAILSRGPFDLVFCFGLLDRKSTRLNSSHSQISYAVFCLKKKKNIKNAAIDTS